MAKSIDLSGSTSPEPDHGLVNLVFDDPDVIARASVHRLPERVRAYEGEHSRTLDLRRFFLLGELNIPLHDFGAPLRIHAWVEVPSTYFALLRSTSRRHAVEQGLSIRALLANSIPTYAGSLRLPVTFQLHSDELLPRIFIDRDVGHPLAKAHREGISRERAQELLRPSARLPHTRPIRTGLSAH